MVDVPHGNTGNSQPKNFAEFITQKAQNIKELIHTCADSRDQRFESLQRTCSSVRLREVSRSQIATLSTLPLTTDEHLDLVM